jgi:hypothetical protein
MKQIASLFKQCLIDGKYVGDDVVEFRKSFQTVHYSYDDPKTASQEDKELREGSLSVTA